MISVCMCTYNGAKYIKEQVESILRELTEDDELIVSDDGSVDDTLQIIEKFNDSRVKILHSTAHSPIYNFEYALMHAKGDYIFLSDQDDVWNKGRVKEALRLHQEFHKDLVLCNAELIDQNGVVFDKSFIKSDDPTDHSLLKNLIHNPYTGNCMSFSRRLLHYILPFPKGIAMHDIWIGLVAQKYLNCAYCPIPLVKFRRHGQNFTAKHKCSFKYKILYRLKFIKEIYCLSKSKVNVR